MEASASERWQQDGAPIGQGRATRVVRVTDRELRRTVTISGLRPELAGDPRVARRFDREVHRTAFVSHPAWHPRLAWGHGREGWPFVVSPLADGSFARFRADAPTWDELLRLILGVLDGLAWYHARGGVHANLKPEDLLVVADADGHAHARIADPHLGAVIGMLAGRESAPGALGYAAPEQRADRAPTRQVDLFALGVVLWEVTTGDLPFGATRGEGAGQRPLPPFVPRMMVPSRLETVLANLLHAKPFGRYDLAADVRTELTALGPADRVGSGGRAAPRDGTVAQGFVATGIFQTDETLDDVSFRGMTSEEILALAPWNRPLPPALNPSPPPELAGEVQGASVEVRVGREVPTVGRGQAREALWAAAREVVAGKEPRVVVVRGPASAGRTRLIRSVTTALEQGGQAETVWCGYAPDAADDGTTRAARVLLRADQEADRDALMAKIRGRLLRERTTGGRAVPTDAAVLARWCGPLEDREPPAPAGVAINEVLRHLEARAWRGLGVLVLDDVQWAAHDDAVAIAERASDRVQDGLTGASLLIVVSASEEAIAADPGLEARLERLVAQGAVQLEVPLLGPVATEALVEATAPLAPALRARVVEECGSRLWRVPQILRALDEIGALVPGDEVGLKADATAPAFDDEVVRERIERLAARTANARRFVDVVHLLALVGPRVPWTLAEDFAGPELVDEVAACDLWRVTDGAVVFASAELHEWVRAAANERPDTSYLHRRIGRAWDRVGSAVDHGLRAGLHAVEAGDGAFAVRALTRAAEVAWASGCTPVLVRAAALSARVAGGAAGLEGASLLWQGRAEEARCRFSEASERFEQARVALDSAGDAAGALGAALGVAGSRLQLGEVDSAHWLFTEIVDRARQRELLRPEALGLAGLAAVAERKRSFAEAEQLWGRVVARTAKLGDLRFAGESLLGQAELSRRLGRYEDADELYHEAATAYRDGLDPVGELRAELGLATSFRHRRPDDEAEGRMQRCLERAEGFGDAVLWSRLWVGLGDLARHRGDADRAERRYAVAEDWAVRIGSFEEAVGVALGRALAGLGVQDLAVAYEQTRRAAQWLDQRPGHPLWAPYRLVVAALLAHRRDHTQTWQWLWSAQEVGVAELVDRDTAGCLIDICDVAAEAGWGNVLRLAGKLGADQLERLEDEASAIRLKQRVANALL